MPTPDRPLPGANGPTPLLATYRLQLNHAFDFEAALGLLPYLATLGVSHVYCSPILAAQPGSMHGYDVVDPQRVDPALGGEEGFARLAEAAHAAGMGVMVDIVPNHMGIAGPANRWWDDVLLRGRDSPHAHVFDIDWDADPDGRLRLPLLGGSIDEAREAGHLELRRGAEGGWRLRYHEHDLPVAAAGIEALERRGGGSAAEGPLRDADALAALLEAQHYRLLHWTEAARSINYRRFFEVSTLAGVRAEDPAVFEAAHGCILSLVERGLVDALRIDHPDGLRDPAGYFRRLQDAIASRRPDASPFYIAAEKILAPGEPLPADWPIAGTTGYDFANHVAGLMVDGDQVPALDAAWRAFTGETATTFAEVALEARREILLDAFGSELRRLVALALAAGAGEEPGIWPALVELVAAFPVYRTYRVPGEPPSDADRTAIEHASRVARQQLETHGGGHRERALASLAALTDTLLGMPGQPAGWEFIARFQQLTAPIAAKGVEDTAIYRFARIASVNGVGGDPDLVGLSVDRFHQACERRLAEWPDAMLATSTHDNKRSEDVTMRIDALSEMPSEWSAVATAWRDAMGLAADLPRDDEGPLPPVNPGDLYLLMQTALGAWPVPVGAEAASPPSGERRDAFADRLVAYMTKACREAKRETSWTAPDARYEAAIAATVHRLLDAAGGEPSRLAARLRWHGGIGSLSMSVLKACVPGMPDIYRGAELIDDSLVDPDNRRPVDFSRRRMLLDEIAGIEPAGVEAALAGWWRAGDFDRLKLWCLHRLLSARRCEPMLFARGDYLPVVVRGSRARHLVAFARRLADAGGERVMLVLATRLPLGLGLEPGRTANEAALWDDTSLDVAGAALPMGSWRDLLDGRELRIDEGLAPVAGLLGGLPCAVLLGGSGPFVA